MIRATASQSKKKSLFGTASNTQTNIAFTCSAPVHVPSNWLLYHTSHACGISVVVVLYRHAGEGVCPGSTLRNSAVDPGFKRMGLAPIHGTSEWSAECHLHSMHDTGCLRCKAVRLLVMIYCDYGFIINLVKCGWVAHSCDLQPSCILILNFEMLWSVT